MKIKILKIFSLINEKFLNFISKRYLIRYGKLVCSENKRLFLKTLNITDTIRSKIEKLKEDYFNIDFHVDLL